MVGKALDEAEGIWSDLPIALRAPALARAANAGALLEEGAAELKDASAVLAVTEAVDGAETRIDLKGDSKVTCDDTLSARLEAGT